MAKRAGGGILGTLSALVFLRVGGVSLVLAGFVSHGESLGGSVFSSGLAFAAYPLALALLIYPFSALSDRIGRRPVLVAGLVIAGAGGLLASWAPTMAWLAAGRALQGAGAINGVALAVAGETGPPERRARRMAALGASAGMGFAAGLILGAVFTPLIGVGGLLLLHGVASLLLVPVVMRTIPSAPPERPVHVGPVRALELRALAVGAFAINFSLTGLLFLSPLLLLRAAPDASYALLLTLMVLPAGAGIFISSRLADHGHARAVGLAAAALLAAGPVAFLDLAPLHAGVIVGAGIAYFLGHSALTALLPALASALAPAGRRGAAQGLQSTLQYFGSAAGSATVAALYPASAALVAAFLVAGAVAALAVLIAARPGAHAHVAALDRGAPPTPE